MYCKKVSVIGTLLCNSTYISVYGIVCCFLVKDAHYTAV